MLTRKDHYFPSQLMPWGHTEDSSTWCSRGERGTKSPQIRKLFLLDRQEEESRWGEQCGFATWQEAWLKVKEREKHKKNNYSLIWNAFSYLRLYPLRDSPSLPGRLRCSPKEQWNVLFAISTFLMQFASHKGPPTTCCQRVISKTQIQYNGSKLTADKTHTNPEGSEEICDLHTMAGGRLSAQASQADGFGFESQLHLLNVGPWLRSQSLGLLMEKGTVSMIKCVVPWSNNHTVGAPVCSLLWGLRATMLPPLSTWPSL